MDVRGIFAYLEPLNDEAKEALDYPENALAVYQWDGQQHPTTQDSDGNDEESWPTDTESVLSATPGDPSRTTNQTRRVFIFAFVPPPPDPHRGWWLGSDPHRCHLLLTKKKPTSIAKRHIRIHFHRESGHMLISDHSRVGIHIQGETLQRSSRAISSDVTQFVIGTLPFRLILENSDRKQYENQLRIFLQLCGNTIRSPIATLSPVPQGQQRVFRGYIFCANEESQGAFGKVHMAIKQSTGALRAIKELVRTTKNHIAVSSEIRIAEANNHVSMLTVVRTSR